MKINISVNFFSSYGIGTGSVNNFGGVTRLQEKTLVIVFISVKNFRENKR